MSIRVIELVYDRFPGAGSDLLILLALADWCGDDGGKLFPSIGLLAAKTRLSESQARRVLHKLIREGYVAVVGNAYGGAPGKSRNYRLNVEMLSDLPVVAKIAEHRGRARARGSRAWTNGDQVTPSVDETPRAVATPSTDANPTQTAQNGWHEGSGRLASMRETACTHDTQDVKETLTIRDVGFTPFSHPKKEKAKATFHRNSNFDVEDLVAEGVDRQHAIDWMTVRKEKRTPLTTTAWEAHKAEGLHAGITPAAAVQRAAERGWVNFRARYDIDVLAREKRVGTNWWASDELALAKAKTVGVGPARQHESRDAWHARIAAAIDNGGTSLPSQMPLPPSIDNVRSNNDARTVPSDASRVAIAGVKFLLKNRQFGVDTPCSEAWHRK